MTAPLTYEDALAAAAALQASVTTSEVLLATMMSVSESVIVAREAAAAYAKALILGLWRDVDPYSGRAVQGFAAGAADVMATAQTVAARAAGAGQEQLLTSIGERTTATPSDPIDVRAPRVDVVDGRVLLRRPDEIEVEYRTRGGVVISAEDFTTEGVFNRPARTLRALEADGATRQVADDAAQDRIELLIDDNLMLAQRLAESEVLIAAAEDPASTIVGTRRIIHPELSRTGVCGLCVAASDRLYTVRELRPIHDRCKCTTAPVTEEHDPADDLNAVDLARIYELSGGTSGAHLKRTRYQIDEHGELGPVLVPSRKYKPRGKKAQERADVVAVSEAESPAEVARRHLPILEGNLAKLRGDGLPEGSPQITYHRNQIAKYRETLSGD